LQNKERLDKILSAKFCPECGNEIDKEKWNQIMPGDFKAQCSECESELLIMVTDLVESGEDYYHMHITIMEEV
jgi:DNA-directed RNA polymerase subunit RPC12/RpoP